jgi:uncharacterized protein (DUF433 family)
MTMTDWSELGLYTVADAARYARVPVATARRWLMQRGAQALLSFDQFVSLLVLGVLRREARVPLGRIIVAEDYLRARTGYPFPFAHQRLWVEGREILVSSEPGELPSALAEYDTFLVASRRGQLTVPGVATPTELTLPPWAEDLKQTLEYSEGWVVAWKPTEHVVAQPLVQVGRPCVAGTRVPTRTLYSAFLAGDSVEALSDAFDLPLNHVAEAVKWEQQLAA